MSLSTVWFPVRIMLTDDDDNIIWTMGDNEDDNDSDGSGGDVDGGLMELW